MTEPAGARADGSLERRKPAAQLGRRRFRRRWPHAGKPSDVLAVAL